MYWTLVKNLAKNLETVVLFVVPEQPRDLRGEAVSATAIQLEWTAPHTVGSDPVTSYELYYNDSTRRQNVHLTISAPVDSYLLEDLSANSVYNIRVSAATSHGEGPTTAAISVRTREAGEFVISFITLADTNTSHRLFATCFVGSECHSEYSSK